MSTQDSYAAGPGIQFEGEGQRIHFLSLRDWFAGQALVLIKADCVNKRAPDIARAAYAVADAMLAAREGGAA